MRLATRPGEAATRSALRQSGPFGALAWSAAAAFGMLCAAALWWWGTSGVVALFDMVAAYCL